MNSPGQDSSDPKESHTPPSGHSADNKRRKPAVNGRGVNTLSKEALDKKRDNDRKAQAAIRKRQKEEVAALRSRIEELGSQQPHLQLKSVTDERDAIQSEYDKLRLLLSTFIDTVKPLVAPGIHDLTAIARHNAQAALAASRSPDPNFTYQAADQASYTGSSPFPTNNHDSNDKSPRLPHRGAAVRDQNYLIQRQHQLNKDESLDFRFLLDAHDSNSARSNPVLPPRRSSLGISSTPSSVNGTLDAQQPWSMLPLISPPDTPLDQLLTDFIYDHQQPSALPRSSTYPTNPSIMNLLNPLDSTTSSGSASPDISRHMRDSANHSSHSPDVLSSYMTKLVMWFDGLSGLPEKVAVCYTMYGLLRWQTYPTRENYHLIPEFMRPSPSQLTIRHPAWFDHVAWPEMREKLIHSPHDHYRFSRRWFEPFTEGLSVNWPYAESTCLANTGKDGQEEISPAFLEHISRLDSWTLDPRFLNAFPEFRGTANCKDKIQNTINSHTSNGHMAHEFRTRGADPSFAPNRGGHNYDHQRHLSNARSRDTGG